MADNLKKVLVNNDGLEITFFVDEGIARIEYKSNGRFDLSVGDDVVLVVNGTAIQVESQSSVFAIGKLGAWDDLSNDAVSIMTRVDDFFEGWEFDP